MKTVFGLNVKKYLRRILRWTLDKMQRQQINYQHHTIPVQDS